MQGRWIRRPNGPGGSVIIVFIHGFFSSSESCWQHKNGATWPQLVAAEHRLRDIGIYEFDYQTNFFSGSYSLDDVVDSLRASFQIDGLSDADCIVFVSHSMGGVVARRYIVRQARELVRTSTKMGLFLVASPSLGSTYAIWLRPLAKLLGHTQAEALAFCDRNSWLKDLNEDFKSVRTRNELSIFGQELVEDKFITSKWLGFLPRVASTIEGAKFFGDPLRVPGSDHFSIAKPESANAVQHGLLCRFMLDHDYIARSANGVVERSNEISVKRGRLSLRVVFGDICDIPLGDSEVVALPCNEFYDSLCSADTRSALGSFVDRYFPGRSQDFSDLVTTECEKSLIEVELSQKTSAESARSYGVGTAILLRQPLGASFTIALAATTQLNRAGFAGG